ncbi:hypothetical protein [Brachyspira murdochii]|nr:hypothetical protein [Brachyspira murdochii]
MGSTDAAGQLWLLPVKKNEKDYLVRLVEHGGPEMYIISDLQSELSTYQSKAQESLTKALSLAASGGDTSAIEDACYESILNDANYKANKYFLDVIDKMGAKGGTGGIYASSSKPITHYVIDIVDIQKD